MSQQPSPPEELGTGERDALRQRIQELELRNAGYQQELENLCTAHRHLTEFVNRSDLMALSFDLEWRLLAFTPAAGRLLRVGPGDQGLPLGDLLSRPVGGRLLAGLDHRAPAAVETIVGPVEDRWYSRQVRRFGSTETDQPAAMLIFSDVSALQRRQGDLLADNETLMSRSDRRAMLLGLQHQIAIAANESETLVELLGLALDRVGRALKWPLGHVYQLDYDTPLLRSSRVWYTDGNRRDPAIEEYRRITAESLITLDEGLIGRVRETGQPLWMDDIRAEKNFSRRIPEGFPYPAVIGFPIAIGRHVVAVIEFYNDAPFRPGQRLLETMDNIGLVLGRAYERDRTRRQLRESRQFIENIADTAPFMVYVYDLIERRNVYVNSQITQMLGYSPGFFAMQGSRLIESVVHPDDQTRVSFSGQELRRMLEGERVDTEFRVRHADGGWRWLRRRAVAFMRTEEGRLRSILAAVQDVTDWKMAEDGLRESEMRFRAIFEQSPLAITLATTDGRFVRVNAAAERMFGYPHEELLGLTFLDLTYPDDREAGVGKYRQLAQGEIPSFSVEKRYRRKDGRIIWGNVFVTLIRDQHGEPRFTLGMVKDITERKQAEEELRHLQKEILELSVREQRRLGQELHDGLGQQLTGLGLIARTLARKLQARGLPEADTMEELVEGLAQSLSQVRGMSKGLLPVEIDAAEFVKALRDALGIIEKRAGIRCKLHTDGAVRLEDNGIATNLFKICQESLINAVKHARPRNIEIEISHEQEELIVRISDDGTGMPEAKDLILGGGLNIMRYRANEIGAQLEIRPAKPTGTVITLRLKGRHFDGA